MQVSNKRRLKVVETLCERESPRVEMQSRFLKTQ